MKRGIIPLLSVPFVALGPPLCGNGSPRLLYVAPTDTPVEFVRLVVDDRFEVIGTEPLFELPASPDGRCVWKTLDPDDFALRSPGGDLGTVAVLDASQIVHACVNGFEVLE